MSLKARPEINHRRMQPTRPRWSRPISQSINMDCLSLVRRRPLLYRWKARQRPTWPRFCGLMFRRLGCCSDGREIHRLGPFAIAWLSSAACDRHQPGRRRRFTDLLFQSRPASTTYYLARHYRRSACDNHTFDHSIQLCPPSHERSKPINLRGCQFEQQNHRHNASPISAGSPSR